MEKIYLVFHGEYSDRSCWGVFSNEQIAEEAAKAIGGDTEKFDLDPKFIVPNMDRFKVRMFQNGDVENVFKCEEKLDLDFKLFELPNFSIGEYNRMNYEKIEDPEKKFLFYIETYAKCEKHAIKIANEIRIQCLAENYITRFEDHINKYGYVNSNMINYSQK